jgi:N-methylhydantoinase B
VTAELDPITFEVLRHKFWQAAEEMGIILVQASSSPVVTEVQDFATVLFDARGNLVAMGNNVIPHVVPMQFAVRAVIDECSENPGINEGDAFIVNDPHRGAMHQSDIIITAPVHHRGRLVGWTGCHCHHADVGAMIPGGYTIGAREIYQEGLRLPPVKFIERGVLRKDLWTMLFNHIRVPHVALDLKAQIAANNVGGKRIVEMCERYGADAVSSAMELLQQHSESRLRARLAELPDGTFRHIDRQDHDGLSPGIYRLVMAVTKKGDGLHFDFTGSSAQTEGFVNCCIGGAWAGVFGVVAPWLASDIPWNAGLLKAVTVTAPDGSICNAQLPVPVSKGGTGTMWSIRNSAQLCLSKLLGCSDRDWQDAMAIWQGAVPIPTMFGRNQNGKRFTYLNMDGSAGGCGAVAVRDGTDTAGNQVSPAMSIPNIETHEAHHPILYLFRRQCRDSAGAGKFRGGVGLEEMFTVHDADHIEMTLAANGIRVANAEGLFGGLPGSCNFWGVVRTNSSPEDGFEPVLSFDDVSERIEPLSNEPRLRLGKGDLFYMRCTGGGGYGDPLDRDPERVVSDIRRNLVSADTAQKLYGVVRSADGNLDAAATQQRRDAMRQARLGGRAPVQAKANGGRRVGRFGEYLEVIDTGGSRVIACRCCGHHFCDAAGNPKAAALRHDMPLREAGPLFPADDNTACILRVHVCPGCGTQIGAEIAEKGSTPLVDIMLAQPQ